MIQVTYVVQQEKEGDYSIYSPVHPVSSCGDTQEEAIKNFQEAMKLYYEEQKGEIQEGQVEFGKMILNA